jgi:S-formylglutathione hydrolase FrmB
MLNTLSAQANRPELISESIEGNFRYQRYRWLSKTLGREVTVGRAIPAQLESETQLTGTVYLLHGGNGDDTQPTGFLPLIPADAGLQIIMPWIGTSFLRHDSASSERSYDDYFLGEVLPWAETATGTSAMNRFIAGYSMGGQAALNTFFRRPELFSGVGAHFPTLIDFDYSHPEAVQSFAARARVVEPWLEILVGGFRTEFRSLSEFVSHDPITLARAIDPERVRGKKIYFDVGGADEFGLFEGARVLDQVLTERHIPHVFGEMPDGRHDAAFLGAQLGKLLGTLLK